MSTLASLSVEPIGTDGFPSGPYPDAIECVRTDVTGLSVVHTVRPGDAAYSLLLALHRDLTTMPEHEVRLLEQRVDRALGYGPERTVRIRRTPQQTLAGRVTGLGYSRDARLALASRTLSRDILTFNELSVRECVRVWERACDFAEAGEVLS